MSLLPGEPHSDEATLQKLIAEHSYFLGGDQMNRDIERRWLPTLLGQVQATFASSLMVGGTGLQLGLLKSLARYRFYPGSVSRD